MKVAQYRFRSYKTCNYLLFETFSLRLRLTTTKPSFRCVFKRCAASIQTLRYRFWSYNACNDFPSPFSSLYLPKGWQNGPHRGGRPLSIQP